MIDREFERQVRGWFAAEVPESVSAPAALRASVRMIPRVVDHPKLLLQRRPRIWLLAAAIVTMSVVGLAVTWSGHPGPSSTLPTTSASPTPASVSPAPARASWTRVGDLLEPRAPGAGGAGWATRLADGRVLVAGGTDVSSGSSLASAEIFDPSTDTWSATGAMTTARADHTLTLLADGRVLAAGGASTHDTSQPLATAELYDPVTGSWSPTGSMTVARTRHTATALLDGRVLVAGGEWSSAEIYDPATGQWTATGSMHDERWLFSAARLNDGRVLVEGTGHLIGMSSAELFDPRSGTWATTADMAASRGSQRSLLLDDGRVLVVGGQHRGTALTLGIVGPEIFDPASGTWRQSGPADRLGGAIALAPLSDGRVLVITTVSAFIFDPSSDRWTATVRPSQGRETLIALEGGRVLLFGDVPSTGDDGDPRTTLVFDAGSEP